MKSIHQLQEQVSAMKTQDKEHRRSALIQSLRKKQREQDLTIDVLKETLATKAPEFQESISMVNEFILKKTLSGPKRFRPKTREELELEFIELDKKYKRAITSLKQSKEVVQETTEELNEIDNTTQDVVPESSKDSDTIALEEELDRLRIAIASKDMNLNSQREQIKTMELQLEQLINMQDKCERSKKKYAACKEVVKKLEEDAMQLIQEKEKASEARAQAEAQLEFLKEAHANDTANGDKDKLELFEKIKAMNQQEMDLQTQIDDQQKKWCIDRSNMNSQLRILEKQLQESSDQMARLNSAQQALLSEKGIPYSNSPMSTRLVLESMSKKIIELTQQLEQASQSKITEPSVPLQSIQSDELAQKEAMWKQAIDDRDAKLKGLDKQVVASKLLARQSKKEKASLLQQIDKLRTLLAETAPKTESSALMDQLRHSSESAPAPEEVNTSE
ncbi:hypothetical protein THRCLA_06311 [Thraustotheca clavata]|uniref:Uncharacterized protein n=1 Tax=Thraustotheca clavata TaxID=74557 RepID=A0A1V9ZPT0_9STRA|nr:hypothetical protein THRCLA_06311 [Thraustotheca clavata]